MTTHTAHTLSTTAYNLSNHKLFWNKKNTYNKSNKQSLKMLLAFAGLSIALPAYSALSISSAGYGMDNTVATPQAQAYQTDSVNQTSTVNAVADTATSNHTMSPAPATTNEMAMEPRQYNPTAYRNHNTENNNSNTESNNSTNPNISNTDGNSDINPNLTNKVTDTSNTSHPYRPQGINQQTSVFLVKMVEGQEQLIPLTSANAIAPQTGDIVEYRSHITNNTLNRVRSMMVTVSIPEAVELIGHTNPQFAMGSLDQIKFYHMPLQTRIEGIIQNVPLANYKALRWQVEDLDLGETNTLSYRARFK